MKQHSTLPTNPLPKIINIVGIPGYFNEYRSRPFCLYAVAAAAAIEKMLSGFIIDKILSNDFKTILKRNFRYEMMVLMGVGLVANIFFLMNGFETDTGKYISCYIRSSIPDDLGSFIIKQCWIGGNLYIDEEISNNDVYENKVTNDINSSRSVNFRKKIVAKMYPYTSIVFMVGNFVATLMLKLPKRIRNCLLNEESMANMKKEDMKLEVNKRIHFMQVRSLEENEKIVADMNNINTFNKSYLILIRVSYMGCILAYGIFIWLFFTQGGAIVN
ncbi:MAG: hypothetical protein MHMPM18_004388 [Marteilia pararefringens]